MIEEKEIQIVTTELHRRFVCDLCGKASEWGVSVSGQWYLYSTADRGGLVGCWEHTPDEWYAFMERVKRGDR